MNLSKDFSVEKWRVFDIVYTSNEQGLYSMNKPQVVNTSTAPEKEEENNKYISLSFERFFDLEGFAHKDLFSEGVVWTALKQLKQYIDSYECALNCDVPDGVTLVNEKQIEIGEGSVIEPGAYIEGPCVIGKGCVVRHGAYVRKYTLTGDECVIGHCSEVKHSILLNRAKAPHFNYVGDSIVGNGVNLGAGVICANLRLDKGEVFVHVNGQKTPTGLKKLGAIIGDGSSLGCNGVTNPGALFAKNSLSSPCRGLKGTYK